MMPISVQIIPTNLNFSNYCDYLNLQSGQRCDQILISVAVVRMIQIGIYSLYQARPLTTRWRYGVGMGSAPFSTTTPITKVKHTQTIVTQATDCPDDIVEDGVTIRNPFCIVTPLERSRFFYWTALKSPL